MVNFQNYIFVDESGDPGKPFKINADGNKVPTGSSLFYIITAIYLDSIKLFRLETKIMEIRIRFNFLSEIKSTIIPLIMYKELLQLINELHIPVYYRLIEKLKYKGKFAVSGHIDLYNIFDNHNLSEVVLCATKSINTQGAEVVIDRADRRMWKGDHFSEFNRYLFSRVNTPILKLISHITHVNSEYVNAMQLSDLVSGAIRDGFTGKNLGLVAVINDKYLNRIL